MRSYEGVRPLSVAWQKSSLCQTGECVEIARQNDLIIMRNSARPNSGYVYFTPEEFNAFLGAAGAGKFDQAG